MCTSVLVTALCNQSDQSRCLLSFKSDSSEAKFLGITLHADDFAVPQNFAAFFKFHGSAQKFLGFLPVDSAGTMLVPDCRPFSLLKVHATQKQP